MDNIILNNETWKDAIGYEGKWQVSNLGRIRTKNSGNIRNPKKPSTNGYIILSNRNNGKKEGVYLHRLVAGTFIPNPENKPMVNHKNGNKVDNRVDNLEWVTNQENMKHACRFLGCNSKEIRCIDNDLVFANCSAAAEWLLNEVKSDSKLKTTTNHIWEAVVGKRNVVYGYRWEKVDEVV